MLEHYTFRKVHNFTENGVNSYKYYVAGNVLLKEISLYPYIHFPYVAALVIIHFKYF